MPWGLGVPAHGARRARGSTLTVFDAFQRHDWIGNSRNRADEHVIRTLASMTGFAPRMTHRADSLDLVEEMIVAGMGVGLLPARRRTTRGVVVPPLTDPDLTWRAHAVHRRGRDAWPPLALVLERLGREEHRSRRFKS
jgi:DNA-binding transcriptional LysR family regulator